MLREASKDENVTSVAGDSRRDAGWLRVFSGPLNRGLLAVAAGVILLILSATLLLGTQPQGNPYVKSDAGWWRPLFFHHHEPAYAESKFQPVGSQMQLLHAEHLEALRGQDPAIRGLRITPQSARNILEVEITNPDTQDKQNTRVWRQVKRLFLTEGEVATDGERQKGIAALGLIDVNDKVYFYKDGVWRPADLTPFDAVGELLNQLVPLIDSLPKIADPGKFDISIIPTALETLEQIIFSDNSVYLQSRNDQNSLDVFSTTIFPTSIRSLARSDNGSLVAVGDRGAIYLGRFNQSNRPAVRQQQEQQEQQEQQVQPQQQIQRQPPQQQQQQQQQQQLQPKQPIQQQQLVEPKIQLEQSAAPARPQLLDEKSSSPDDLQGLIRERAILQTRLQVVSIMVTTLVREREAGSADFRALSRNQNAVLERVLNSMRGSIEEFQTGINRYNNQIFPRVTVGAELGRTGSVSWSIVRPPTNLSANVDPHSFRAVDFDGPLGIAVGDKGLYVTTRDGGATWSDARPSGLDPIPDFKDVRVNGNGGESHAIAVADLAGGPGHGVLYSLGDLNAASAAAAGAAAQWQQINWRGRSPLIIFPAVLAGVVALLIGAYFLLLWYRSRRAGQAPVAAGKTDREIGWGDEDALGLKQIALQVSAFLRNVQTQPPLVLGVSGGWGSGKSSLMNLLCTNLQDHGSSAIWFNAWHHQNEEHLLAALFEAVRSRAVPRFWSVNGLVFRIRLMGPRLTSQLRRAWPLLVLFGLLIISVGWFLPGEIKDGAREHYQSFFAEQAGDRVGDDNQEAVAENDQKEDGNTAKSFWDEILYALIGGPSLYLLFVWLRSLWVAMPVNPAGLIDKLGRFARVGHFRDKLSFRHKFGGAFGEVCAALRMPGRPGLIIFIDDLDRCSAESVLAIFEAVNYFVSTGDCIVVMGFDRRQVEHSIGNELKDIADGVPNDEIPFHFDPENQVEKRRAYARLYMEKLINLEIRIPKLTPEAAASLGSSADEKQEEDEEKLAKNTLRWIDLVRPRVIGGLQVLRGGLQALVICVIAYFAWQHSTELYQHISTPVETPIDAPPSLPDGENNGAAASGEDTTGADRQNTAAPTSAARPETIFIASEQAPERLQSRYSIWEFVVLTGLVFLCALAAFWIFLQRAFGLSGRVEHDPEAFVVALRKANQLVNSINSTPRAIKRFMNRMRFAASRSRSIRYTTSPVDRLAVAMGWVDEDFRDQSRSKPNLQDDKLIALGTMESLMEVLPNPDDGTDDPAVVLSDYQKKHADNADVQTISSDVARLLEASHVGPDDLKTYIHLLHPPVADDPIADEEDATDENAAASPSTPAGKSKRTRKPA